MQRRARSCVAVVALIALASGCAGGLDHTRRHSGHETLRIVNATAAPLCEVFVATHDEQLWGRSWTDRPVAPGEHVELALRPDEYMLRVGRCDGRTAVVAYRIALDGDLAVVIHDGYPPDTARVSGRELALPSWSVGRSARGQYPRLVQPGTGTGDQGVEVEVRNRCARDLRVVLGGDPRTQSGTPSTLPAHARLRYFAASGTRLWLVDEHYETISSTELSPDARRVEVSPTCDAFSAS